MQDIKDSLVSKIFGVQKLLIEQLKKSPDSFHYSLVQLKTLRFISEHKNSTMKNIADFLCVMPPSATAIVDRLIAEEFVVREADLKDRRLVRLSITPSGKRQLSKGYEHIGKEMRVILARLTKDEQAQLSAIFDKLLGEISNNN